MPSVSLHLVLADRVLEGWTTNPRAAPFDPDDPAAVNAFYQGALGPDLGYFPGGYRLLSDLAHRVRSAVLSRFLVVSARAAAERAFSWGWVAHFLADRAIHPLVGRGVGEFVHGDRTRFVDGFEEPAAHVRVETGLDVLYMERSALRPSGPRSLPRGCSRGLVDRIPLGTPPSNAHVAGRWFAREPLQDVATRLTQLSSPSR
jgi:hypothetical protein